MADLGDILTQGPAFVGSGRKLVEPPEFSTQGAPIGRDPSGTSGSLGGLIGLLGDAITGGDNAAGRAANAEAFRGREPGLGGVISPEATRHFMGDEAADEQVSASDIYKAGKDAQATQEADASAVNEAKEGENASAAVFADTPQGLALQQELGAQAQAAISKQLLGGFGAGAAAGLVDATQGERAEAVDAQEIAQADLQSAREGLVQAQEDVNLATTAQSEELADIRASQLDDIKANNEVAHQVFKEQAAKSRATLDEYHAARRRYAETEIGNNPTRAQQIGSSIAIALGAFGAAIRSQKTGVPAVNMAAQVVQQNIDNMLKQQQLELNKRGQDVAFAANAVSITRGIFSDERQAMEAARNMLLQTHIAETKSVMQRTNSPVVKAQGDQLVAKLETDFATTDRAIAVQSAEAAKGRAVAALSADAANRGAAGRARGAAELQLAIANRKAAFAGKAPMLTTEQASKRGSGVRQGWGDIKFLKKAVDEGFGVGLVESKILRPDQEDRNLFSATARAAVTTFGDKRRIQVNQKFLNLSDTILRLRSGAQASEPEARRQMEIIGGGAGASQAEAEAGLEQAEQIFLNRAQVVAVGNPRWALENFGAEVISEMASRGMLPPRVMQQMGF